MGVGPDFGWQPWIRPRRSNRGPIGYVRQACSIKHWRRRRNVFLLRLLDDGAVQSPNSNRRLEQHELPNRANKFRRLGRQYESPK